MCNAVDLFTDEERGLFLSDATATWCPAPMKPRARFSTEISAPPMTFGLNQSLTRRILIQCVSRRMRLRAPTKGLAERRTRPPFASAR